MKTLTKNELNQINGGAVLSTKSIIFGGIVTFIIGLFDGFINLKKCSK